jgi:hypothetical protein
LALQQYYRNRGDMNHASEIFLSLKKNTWKQITNVNTARRIHWREEDM